MMEFTDLVSSIVSGQDFLYQFILLIFATLYSIFSVILYVQITSLIRYVDQTSFSPVLRFVAIGNIVASVFVIGYTILSLVL